jgi:hypothetical protein
MEPLRARSSILVLLFYLPSNSSHAFLYTPSVNHISLIVIIPAINIAKNLNLIIGFLFIIFYQENKSELELQGSFSLSVSNLSGRLEIGHGVIFWPGSTFEVLFVKGMIR